MTLLIQLKIISCTCNLLLGITTIAGSLRLQIMQIIQFFKSCSMKKHVFQNELEKQRWDDSILVLKMKLENVLTKKIRLRTWEYSHDEFLYLLTECGLTMNTEKNNVISPNFLVQKFCGNFANLPKLCANGAFP